MDLLGTGTDRVQASKQEPLGDVSRKIVWEHLWKSRLRPYYYEDQLSCSCLSFSARV